MMHIHGTHHLQYELIIPVFTIEGVDATEAFEEIGHSDDARNLMKSFYVADLDSSVSRTWKMSRAALPGLRL